jgi:8-oxo-dGTP pyrophosphatase MutT (NUDIX family)
MAVGTMIPKGQDDNWGCGCAFIKDNKILLGLRCKPGDLPQWCLIGGSIEKGETARQGIKRESREEINVELLTYKLVGVWEEPPNKFEFTFIAETYEGTPTPNTNELSELRYFSLEETAHIELFPATVKSLKFLENAGYLNR